MRNIVSTAALAGWSCPEDAVPEGLVNAIAHRDYRSTAKVQMYMFHDRLEIVTPGGLPAGMREQELGLKSVPRDRLLLLHRIGMVDQIGSGIRRIRQECRDYGVEEPLIKVSEHWVTTTFRRPVSAGARAKTGTAQPGAEQVEAQVGTKSAPSLDLA